MGDFYSATSGDEFLSVESDGEKVTVVEIIPVKPTIRPNTLQLTTTTPARPNTLNFAAPKTKKSSSSPSQRKSKHHALRSLKRERKKSAAPASSGDYSHLLSRSRTGSRSGSRRSRVGTLSEKPETLIKKCYASHL